MLTEKVEKGEMTVGMLDEVLKNPDIFKEEVAKAAFQEAGMGSLVDSQMLELITSANVDGCESFDPAAFFKSDKDEQPDGIKFWLSDSNFTDNFLGKVETNVAPATLRIHKLREEASDGEIIPELGGEEIVETTLFHLYQMIKRQPSGEDGDLLTDGYVNIFYIRDQRGELWAVYCYWYGGGWSVYVFPVTTPSRWLANFQVCSR